jgi:energy-converting hydrogenase B subunit D
MTPLQFALFLLVAVAGSATALGRDLRRQTILLSLYGMVLTILFFLIGSPDVALSEMAVGAAALPLMLLVTIAGTDRSGRQKK